MGKKYGLKLNKGKCEYLAFKNAPDAKFMDGVKVPRKTEVKYLGCFLNDGGNPNKELTKRKQ